MSTGPFHLHDQQPIDTVAISYRDMVGALTLHRRATRPPATFLTPEALDEFRAIWKAEYDEELSQEDTIAKAAFFLESMRLFYSSATITEPSPLCPTSSTPASPPRRRIGRSSRSMRRS